ncbi:MAG: adenylate kinase family protein [Mycoplasmoidaceae bacterium]
MKKIIILLGPPGCGKGTISKELVTDFNFLQLSTGEMFRSELENNGPLSGKINEYLAGGKLVPDEITNQLVANKLKSLENDQRNILLDGFPRNLGQATFLDSIIKVTSVFFIDVEEELIIKRIAGRMNCPKCNRGYNEFFMPPLVANTCDDDQTQLVRRVDDNAETIKQRLATYYESTHPLVEFYQKRGILINILGGNRIEAIIEELKKHLEL